MAIFKNIGSKIKNTGKRLFGAKELKQGYEENRSMLKEMYQYNMMKFKPGYDQYMLSAEEYATLQKNFKRLFLLFALLCGLGVLYALICLINQNWVVCLLALCFSTLCAAFAFRYNFWLYQLRRQSLGCKFSDWYRDVIKHPVTRKGK